MFRNPPGDSAGRLIEAAGLKGTRIGGAAVSEKHANFIVNDQRGTAADVRRLAEHVRAVVAERAGVTLEPEIEFAGDWRDWEPGCVSDPRVPVVVLLGGPSAEHDVSIVSGTAVADALGRPGPPGAPGPHRPRRRAGGGCRRTTSATAGPRPPMTIPRGSAATAR